MSHLILGCGYLGQRVARLWREVGYHVSVVTRSNERSGKLAHEGYHTIVGDLNQAETFRQLPPADVVLLALPGDVTCNVVTRLITAQQIIHVSTTGVYGDAAGAWVDENTPAAPTRPSSQAALAAEQAIASRGLAQRSIILRMAGLYGPGRVPFLDKIRAGKPIPVAEDGWLNLIHVDDAAAIVAETEKKGTCYFYQKSSISPFCLNVTDGSPVRRGDYYREVSRLLGAPPPRFVPPDPNSPRAQRAISNRRVSNERMRRELDIRLQYPSYREGLAAILGGIRS